jgi:hypothetical protein
MRVVRLVATGIVVAVCALHSLGQSIYTVAGGATQDGKPATSVGFGGVADIAVDSLGRL